MSLRRPTVALLLIIFLMSPRCDVAQTSACGIVVIYFPYKPFMWCRSNARLWHALYILIPSRRHFRHSISLSYLYPLIVHFLFMMNDLLACIMNFISWLIKWSWIISVHVYHLLYYTCFHDVCEYIQKYSLACPWLLSWPDFLLGEVHYDDDPGT